MHFLSLRARRCTSVRLLLALGLALSAGACTDAEAPVPPAGAETVDPGTILPGQTGAALVEGLRREFRPTRPRGYTRARDALYAWEASATGAVRDPYTGLAIALTGRQSPRAELDAAGLNTEHVWPQSIGARAEPLRGDMHHLYATLANVNASRGNLPFGVVPPAEATAWYRLRESRSSPPGPDPGGWSRRGRGRFEPRDAAKGDIARAVLYVAAVYGPDVADAGGEAFFEAMRETLIAWHRADPPTDAERARSAFVASEQGTDNPFVLDATLAERAFGRTATRAPDRPRPAPDRAPAPGAPTVPSPTVPSPATPASPLFRITALHYDNAGPDVGEGVEVSGPPGADMAGWTLALVNGADGRTYRTVRLAGRLSAGGTLWTAAEGLQNGPADGVALVDPAGGVVEFLSYEGTLTAADGPARGMTSVDIGAEQSGRDPPDLILRRTGSAWRLAPR